MRRFLFLIIFIVCFSQNLFAQNTDVFKGNWFVKSITNDKGERTLLDIHNIANIFEYGNTISFNMGCNTLNFQIEFKGTLQYGKIIANNGIQTQMWCENDEIMKNEMFIGDFMNVAKTYKYNNDILTFYDNNKTSFITLSKSNVSETKMLTKIDSVNKIVKKYDINYSDSSFSFELKKITNSYFIYLKNYKTKTNYNSNSIEKFQMPIITNRDLKYKMVLSNNKNTLKSNSYFYIQLLKSVGTKKYNIKINIAGKIYNFIAS